MAWALEPSPDQVLALSEESHLDQILGSGPGSGPGTGGVIEAFLGFGIRLYPFLVKRFA
jgi:hypothetical protein